MSKPRKQEEGYVLMLVIIIMAIVFMLLMIASTQTLTTTRVLSLRLTHQGQALNAAHAGLVEGLDYFRRQTPPVTVFDPKRNTNPNVGPVVDETDLVTTPPSIQRDFLISSLGRVWGHYELVQGTSSTQVGVADVTRNRRGSLAGSGSIWRLQSRGSVYIRNDGNVAYNQSPNMIISQKVVETEIQRVGLNIPADAALLINNGNNCSVGTSGASRARVVGTASGIGVAARSGSAVLEAGAVLSGNPPRSTNAGMDYSVNTIFNVSSLTELAAIADHSVTSVANLPCNPSDSVPCKVELPMRLTVIDLGGSGTATFNSTRSLVGSGILVVNGNLVIDGAASTFNGIIYVTGNYTQVGPSTVNGSVVLASSGSTAILRGTSEYAELYFDKFMRTQVATQLGQFRFARPAFIPCPAGDPKCDSKFAEN
jgi:hypothetical protein